MSTRILKYSLAAVALVAVAGVSAPAMADLLADQWMDVSVNSSDGVFNDPHAMSGGSPVYFAGAIQYKDTSNGNFIYNVFCDDPGNDVVVPGTYKYQVEDETYANNYLAPLGLNVTHEIAGLTAYGLANPTNATLDEYVQEAIWRIMGASITLTGATSTGVTALLSPGVSGWDSYWNHLAGLGWSYGELVDYEGCSIRGQITYQNSCQTQGQMYLYGHNGPPPNMMPEPGTMGLLGVGLLGVAGATWRRRKSANRSAA